MELGGGGNIRREMAQDIFRTDERQFLVSGSPVNPQKNDFTKNDTKISRLTIENYRALKQCSKKAGKNIWMTLPRNV